MKIILGKKFKIPTKLTKDEEGKLTQRGPEYHMHEFSIEIEDNDCPELTGSTLEKAFYLRDIASRLLSAEMYIAGVLDQEEQKAVREREGHAKRRLLSS